MGEGLLDGFSDGWLADWWAGWDDLSQARRFASTEDELLLILLLLLLCCQYPDVVTIDTVDLCLMRLQEHCLQENY